MNEFVERFQPYIGHWIAKKSRKLMCSGKHQPCFLLKNILHQRGRIRLKGNGVQAILLTRQNVDEFESIEATEAIRLNGLFRESRSFGEDVLKETCFRKDGITLKIAHTKETFPAALYELKIKYPNEECVAYKCSKCGYFHIGKTSSCKDSSL